MNEPIFMRAWEVAEVLGTTERHAYKVIEQLNKKIEAKGWPTMRGRIDRKFFYDNLYATTTKSKEECGCLYTKTRKPENGT